MVNNTSGQREAIASMSCFEIRNSSLFRNAFTVVMRASRVTTSELPDEFAHPYSIQQNFLTVRGFPVRAENLRDNNADRIRLLAFDDDRGPSRHRYIGADEASSE
jgi:hypothetical protein